MNCKSCNIVLSDQNASKNGVRNGKVRYRNECKPCRSKHVTIDSIGNPKKQAYMREYIRRIGRVKQYPCEICATLCYKKYSKAFCSDQCRFLFYVQKTDSCWLWTGAKNRNGYGKLCFQGNKSAIASRVAYILFNESIDDDKFVCHTCDNPSCVNPCHLWLGTHKENMLDMIEKERQSSKLKSMDILKIRDLKEKNGWTVNKIAEYFKINASTISNILSGRIWKHI